VLLALCGATAAAACTLLGVVVSTSEPTIVIRDSPPVAPSLAEMGLHSEGSPPVGAPQSIDLDEERRRAQIAEEAVELEPAEAETPTSDATAAPRQAKPQPKTATKTTSKTDKPKVAASSKASATPKAAAKAPDLSVECVLDPASCGLGSSRPVTTPSSPPAAVDIPDKLTAATLRTHLSSAKSQAKTCAPRQGATSGESVQVKLSIVGATGRVISATAVGDHAGTALGRCVVDELSAATFPRFSAAQQGVVYRVTM
jgi:hypothetical protein